MMPSEGLPITITKRTSGNITITPHQEPVRQEIKIKPKTGPTREARSREYERHNLLPTYILWDETITPEQQLTIRGIVAEFFSAVGMGNGMVSYLGSWKDNTGHLDQNGNLLPDKSLQWQLENSLNRELVETTTLLNAMGVDPNQIKTPHWEIIFTNRLLTGGLGSVFGGSIQDLGAIISFGALSSIRDPGSRILGMKTLTFHEMGHVVGLPTNRRGKEHLEDRQDRLGLHCRDTSCSMKQVGAAEDLVTIGKRRQEKGGQPYCPECQRDLREKFRRR